MECLANEKKLEICSCDCNFGPPPTACLALDETFASMWQLLLVRTHAQCDSTGLHVGSQFVSAKSPPINFSEPLTTMVSLWSSCVHHASNMCDLSSLGPQTERLSRPPTDGCAFFHPHFLDSRAGDSDMPSLRQVAVNSRQTLDVWRPLVSFRDFQEHCQHRARFLAHLQDVVDRFVLARRAQRASQVPCCSHPQASSPCQQHRSSVPFGHVSVWCGQLLVVRFLVFLLLSLSVCTPFLVKEPFVAFLLCRSRARVQEHCQIASLTSSVHRSLSCSMQRMSSPSLFAQRRERFSSLPSTLITDILDSVCCDISSCPPLNLSTVQFPASSHPSIQATCLFHQLSQQHQRPKPARLLRCPEPLALSALVGQTRLW